MKLMNFLQILPSLFPQHLSTPICDQLVFQLYLSRSISPDHPYHPSNSTGQSENDKPERPALVFRDQRMVPMVEEDELLGLTIGPDGRWISTLEPGEYHGHHASNWDEDAPQQRWFLPVSFNSSLYFNNSLLRNIRPSTGSCPGVTYRRA